MNLPSPQAAVRRLAPGDVLDAAGPSPLWRVRRGVVGVAQVDDPAAGGDAAPRGEPPRDERPQFLALPGDLIGADALVGASGPACVVAVTEAELEALPPADETSRGALLSQAYAQARRQGREILRLRTGALADRVRQLLLLFGTGRPGGDESDVELPSLRQLAGILDASPEAICRVLGRMSQLDVLSLRQPRRARVATRALHALVLPAGMSSSRVPGPLVPAGAGARGR